MAQDGTPNTCEPGYPHESHSCPETHVDWVDYDNDGRGSSGHCHDTSKGSVSLGQDKKDQSNKK